MTDATKFYAGWLVDAADRVALLSRFPPRYALVVAHHVTLKFGEHTAEPPRTVMAEIVGEADDGVGVQALVVAIDGSSNRPDGGTFHVTWSLEPGREAKESNEVIAAGWIPLLAPTPIRLLAKA